MYGREDFTVDAGIEVQARDLADWEKVLSPLAYRALVLEIKRENHLAMSGYDIKRGQDLYVCIVNKIMKKS